MGYTYQFVFLSSYFSNITENADKYTHIIEVEENGVTNKIEYTESEYLNTRVFQDRIFQEFKNDQFNNMVSFGLGIQRFNYQFGVDLSLTLPGKNEYYKNYNQWIIYYNFQLASINLFK